MGPRAQYSLVEDVKLPVKLSQLPTPFVHRFCREGERCTGSGCNVTTGKTRRKRENRYG